MWSPHKNIVSFAAVHTSKFIGVILNPNSQQQP